MKGYLNEEIRKWDPSTNQWIQIGFTPQISHWKGVDINNKKYKGLKNILMGLIVLFSFYRILGKPCHSGTS